MGLKEGLKRWTGDFLSLIYPRLCEVCGDRLVEGEEHLCLQCRCDMPLCEFTSYTDNVMHQRLMGHTPVERAASLFYYYRDSTYARLIHAAKYENRPQVAQWLAEGFAGRLKAEGFFEGIELLVPVPLHPSKQRRRGYNQTHYIARGISAVTGIPMADVLEAVSRHSSQTRLGAYGRWINARENFAVNRPVEIGSRHILLIDDVLTTGATLLACIEAVHKAAPTARISVLTLAVTHLR